MADLPARWLVTGANGQLGHDLQVLLDRPSVIVRAVDLPELDITSASSVAEEVAAFGPDVVVNCAAWTAVDAAESNEPQAFDVNAVGPANLAAACRASGSWLVQVSTDYVFSGSDGGAGLPYPESALPAPRTAYGRTKVAGEWAVRAALPDTSYVVRTAWLYGRNGANFVKTMVRLAGEQDTVSVVDDQWGQPTWSADLAAQIVALVGARPAAGTFHGTNAGRTTWFGFAQAVFAAIGADPARVLPTTSDSIARPAPRPAWSVLGHDAWRGTGVAPMRPWAQALEAAVAAGVTQAG